MDIDFIILIVLLIVYIILIMFSLTEKIEAKYEKLFFNLNIKDIDGNELNMSEYKDKTILYEYYDLELPPEGWLEFCIKHRVLF